MKKARIILAVLCVLTIGAVFWYSWTNQQQEDHEAPVLSADADEIEVSISATDEELTAGVTAWDDTDGDISDRIIIESIEKRTDGGVNEFDITYVAFDESGNVGRLTRTLVYSDYRQSHFSLLSKLRFTQSGTWSLFDYVEVDDCLDGDLTPFLMIEGDAAQSGAGVGLYDCVLSVTNSVGDTAELTVQVEIYENSYEERAFRPSIGLTDYLIYLDVGASFTPEGYLYYVSDSGTWLIDYGDMVQVLNDDGEYEMVTEKEANGEAGNWLNISEIGITSDVDTSVPGIYSVLYTYTSETTSYDCNASLIVVVE
ncbi:MAG: hypothetical protein LUH07_04990 [Lachnospiraceae bacterium]|nr:hypothetical protein [Lachnospiraceae bacterium]